VPSWRFGAIGTHWSIDTPDPLGQEVTAQVLERIERFDVAYSRFRPDSLVSQLAVTPGSVTLPPDAPALFGLYRALYEATRGSLSPLIGDVLNHLGYDPTYRLTSLPGPADPVPPFDDVLRLDGDTLTTYRPVTIDLGAAGKGFLVDLIAGLLVECGVRDYTIDASGDLRHAGSGPEKIALENPRDPTRALGVVTLENRSLAASATNRRVWGDGLHHIVDALTGLPTRLVEATFVVADSAAVADGVATALFFTPPDALGEVFTFDWVMMMSDGELRASPQFPGEVFST
jgi:thiamine biosynthesis lipoprotein